jgi:hypothetical protein
MKQDHRTRLITVGAIALALPLGGCLSATTYGTGVSPGKQTMEDIVGIVSPGAKKGPPIDYAARPPIVAPPPGAAIPKPGETSTASAGNWPADPESKSLTGTLSNGDPADGVQAYDPSKKVPIASRPPSANSGDLAEGQMEEFMKARQNLNTNKQMFAAAKASRVMGVDANGNPIRRTLSEPPVDYRAPDPAAPEAFTEAANKKWWQFERDSKADPTQVGSEFFD